jgi:hypothetical protein
MKTKARVILGRALVALAVLVGLLITAALVTASAWPTINRVEAGKSLEYPELVPRTYQLGYDRVYDEALAAAKEQPGWVLLGEDRAAGRLQAEAVMAYTGWKQSVQVEIKRRGDFVSRVYIVSEGSDAPGDLGQNARNIRGYYESLDRRLGAAKVETK